MPDSSCLRLAFIHSAVNYKALTANQAELWRLNKEAAAAGAQIIINPELALSGYSFRSREDVRPVTETCQGETIQRLRELAQRRQVYICIGWAEREPDTDIFYNSAAVLGPTGEILCHYRKVNAEVHWSCPGPACQDNTFETPWGRVGVLICSDTYYGLMPRATALRGARLLLVPANWPPLGLDPRELWRARALENALYIAACNRTGQDRSLSFAAAPSCLYSPRGETLLEATTPESRIFTVALPLHHGKLDGSSGDALLAQRQVHHYGNIYLDLRLIEDLTAHYELPPAGLLMVAGLAVTSHQEDLSQYLVQVVAKTPTTGSILLVLPQDAVKAEVCGALAARYRVALVMGQTDPAGIVWATPAGVKIMSRPAAGGPLYLNYGPARLAVCSPEALVHPELAVHLAKSGCDLAVVSSGPLTEKQQLVLAVKSLERLALAIATPDHARICLPPAGHQRWHEESVASPGVCRLVLDTTHTRRRRFQDRVDFALLLRRSAETTGLRHNQSLSRKPYCEA